MSSTVTDYVVILSQGCTSSRINTLSSENGVDTPAEKMDYEGFAPRNQSMDAAAARKASVIAMTENVTGEIKNPLVGISKNDLMIDVERFAKQNDMEEELDLLKKGALVAQNPADFENMDELSEEDKAGLREEITRRWKHPKTL